MADVLGTFEQAVLLAILRLQAGAYGRAIHNQVEERLERSVAAGAVHATLTRLEEKGLVSARLSPGTPARAGRPRRYYRVQAAGVRALNDARQAADALWRGFKFPLRARA